MEDWRDQFQRVKGKQLLFGHDFVHGQAKSEFQGLSVLLLMLVLYPFPLPKYLRTESGWESSSIRVSGEEDADSDWSEATAGS